jgi:hypothetical protein
MTATLMCVVWLTTLTMLVRQAQFTNFAANKASLVSRQSVARPIPPLSAHNLNAKQSNAARLATELRATKRTECRTHCGRPCTQRAP